MYILVVYLYLFHFQLIFFYIQGLRVTALVGAFGTALGTIVKVFSGNDIWIAYLGQTILSSMQVFILSLSPRIAAVWFGPKEVRSM